MSTSANVPMPAMLEMSVVAGGNSADQQHRSRGPVRQLPEQALPDRLRERAPSPHARPNCTRIQHRGQRAARR